MESEAPKPLHPIETLLIVIGMAGNAMCCTILFRNRLMPDKQNINLNAVLGFTQSALDLSMGLFYIMSFISYPRIYFSAIGSFICRGIRSNAIFWMLATLRAGLNLVVAILSFIKLIYPFLSTSGNIIGFISSGMTLLTLVAIMQLVPHISSVSYNEITTKSNCNFSAIDGFHELFGIVGLRRFFGLFNFIYLYVFPLTAGLFMYKQVFQCLKESDDLSRKIAYKEMKKNFMMDVILYFICYSLHSIMFFLSEFTEQIRYSITSSTYRWGILIAAMYSVLYPIFSLLTRRSYKKPFLDVIDTIPIDRSRINIFKKNVFKSYIGDIGDKILKRESGTLNVRPHHAGNDWT